MQSISDNRTPWVTAERRLHGLRRQKIYFGHVSGLVTLACLVPLMASTPLSATPITVNYLDAGGMSARAIFDLLDSGNTLQIILENTSTAPFGGAAVNGSANMVLSSVNFDLGSTVDIVDGTVNLMGGSDVVMRTGSNWTVQTTPNLNQEFGFSNNGIGNSPAPFANALHSVTSHSNGGINVTDFEGTSNRGGLDFGLVAPGSTPFGNNKFILDAVDVRLSLSAPLADLSFLSRGSYIEFGSDHAYVAVPEPGALTLVGMALVAAGIRCRALKRRSPHGP